MAKFPSSTSGLFAATLKTSKDNSESAEKCRCNSLRLEAGSNLSPVSYGEYPTGERKKKREK